MTTTTPPNPFELLHRERKAAAIAVYLARKGASADVAAGLSPTMRRVAARIVGVQPPSGETWARVVAILAQVDEREAAYESARALLRVVETTV